MRSAAAGGKAVPASAVASSAAKAIPARIPALQYLDSIGFPLWRADPITRRRTHTSEGVTR